jgi:Putative transposase/Transposase zinc-binding domain/TrwC relaxase
MNSHNSHHPHEPPSLRLADLVRDGSAALHAQYGDRLTREHRHALRAILDCRSGAYGERALDCPDCGHRLSSPRSCGHRNCPQCQHHTASAWLARQQAKLLPVPYFLVTFTLPEALRPVAARHPSAVYHALFSAAAATLQCFARNHRHLQGDTGFSAVLHTHSRRLDYHPHLHVVLPGGALDPRRRQWRALRGRYLFNARQLATVFRAKLLDALHRAGLARPPALPRRWIVHCTRVGNGLPALQYLSRYLYRGVIQERQLLDYDRDNGTVTFRYEDGKTKRTASRTMGLVEFLWQLLRHVLPTGFRRVRDFGFLSGNAKRRLTLLQIVLRVSLSPVPRRSAPPLRCPCCGAAMIMRCFIPPPPRVT